MSADTPTAEIKPAPERKHRWEGVGHDTTDGCARTERTCALCNMVKITVHPPHGLPEWRTFAGKVWQGAATPPCLDRVQQGGAP